jgi:hypothetical protein
MQLARRPLRDYFSDAAQRRRPGRILELGCDRRCHVRPSRYVMVHDDLVFWMVANGIINTNSTPDKVIKRTLKARMD